MSYEECEHGGDPLACPPCQNERGPVKVRGRVRMRYSKPFVARFEGGCARPECGETIFVGEQIAYAWESGDESGKRVVHYPECAR